MTNRGSLQNSYISVRPKKMLTEKGIKSCINRPNTHWKGDQSSKEELFWKAKDPIIFQWLSSSVDRSERDNQLQDTIPQHCGKSIWIQQSEWVLLQICSGHLSTQPLTPPATPLSPTHAIQISKDEVCQVFRKQKRKKAPGPDGVTPACLKFCADKLAPIFTKIFNRSLELCKVPSCFKHSTIIPIPKKSKITGPNDYRPVALMSVVMKSFEKLVLAHLKDITGPSLDPLQFAYRANRFVERCSQHVTVLCAATSRQTRGLCEDPVCGLQLGL